MSTIGDRIFQRRKDLNLTQEELARMMGYKSKSTINKIEQGINDIPQSKIMKFAEVLATTPSFLMGWVDHPQINLQLFADNNTPSELTEGERKWLDLYHRTPEDMRIILINMMNSFDRLPEDRQALALSVIRAALGDH